MFNFINVAYAASDPLANIINQIVNPIIGVLFGLAFVVFLYGVVEFIQGASSDKEVEKGRRHLIYGILGLVIIVGVNGLIELVKSTVNTLGS